MKQYRIPAVFVRGGTSKGLMLREEHLPEDRRKWDPLLLAALGSPDPYGRQLDGMGGGLSSLSKVCVIGAPTRGDADIDYTFGQILVREAHVDWTPLCGNMSSAVGPYAVDEGLVKAGGDTALVRIHNTNTKKIIAAHFPLEDGAAAVDGDLVIPGVAGTGAPVRLDFLDPGGATTGKLLPTGNVVDTLAVPGYGTFEVSMVDASNACVFLRAADIGMSGIEMPGEIEANAKLMRLLSAIRLAASVRMGVAADEEEAAKKTAVPFIGFVAPPAQAVTLAGETIAASRVDLVARVISNGQRASRVAAGRGDVPRGRSENRRLDRACDGNLSRRTGQAARVHAVRRPAVERRSKAGSRRLAGGARWFLSHAAAPVRRPLAGARFSAAVTCTAEHRETACCRSARRAALPGNWSISCRRLRSRWYRQAPPMQRNGVCSIRSAARCSDIPSHGRRS
jgi:2-methylaconitate cis-trans-isomerase PrpF